MEKATVKDIIILTGLFGLIEENEDKYQEILEKFGKIKSVIAVSNYVTSILKSEAEYGAEGVEDILSEVIMDYLDKFSEV